MPRLKSSKKRLLTNHRAQQRNLAARSAMRTAIKKVRQATDPEAARQALAPAISLIDKSRKKGIVHRNTAARFKSRLTRLVQNLA